MKDTHTVGSGFFRARTGLATVALLLAWQAASFANTPNTMPYSESFEAFGAGTVIVDTNGVGIGGWYGSDTSTSQAQAIVVNTNSTYGGAFPIAGTHTNVLSFGGFGGVITNVFTPIPPSPLVTNVTIDVMLQTGFLTSDPTLVGAMPQCAVFVNTNGQLVVRRAMYNGSFTAVSNTWTVLTNGPTLTSNEWVRLTVKLDYMSSLFAEQEHFFQISTDGGSTWISDAHAYVSITGSSLTEGGTFFLCADSGATGDAAGLNNQYFSNLGLMGVGSIDDLVIVPEGAGSVPPPPPVRPQIVALSSGGSSHGLAWQSVTGKYYSVYRSTDLLSTTPVAGGWVIQASNIAADLSGTNIWLDVSLPGAPTNAAFYKTLVQP